MSSYHTASERALSTLALERHAGVAVLLMMLLWIAAGFVSDSTR